jgi:hypothetical protein
MVQDLQFITDVEYLLYLKMPVVDGQHSMLALIGHVEYKIHFRCRMHFPSQTQGITFTSSLSLRKLFLFSKSW